MRAGLFNSVASAQVIHERGTPAEPAHEAKVLLLRVAYVYNPKRLGGSLQEPLEESGLKGVVSVTVQLFWCVAHDSIINAIINAIRRTLLL